MKIAIFKNAEHGFDSCQDESFEDLDGYIRVTEYVEVKFVPLEHSVVAAKEVAILREVKKSLQVQTELKLGDIDRKIGELLALPQEV